MNNIGTINYPAPRQDYKVLVRCYTYNHSKYIEDALNGFAMQQTNFPFVCLVMDDASTDGEQEVIKAWMERECDMSKAETIEIPTSVVIIVPHKTNASCTFAFYLLKQNLYRVKGEKKKHIDPWREKCEYEAMCEGDDYWIDPLKLQIEKKYLDENQNISLVFTNVDFLYQRYSYILQGGLKEPPLTFKDQLRRAGYIAPCTWLYRIEDISYPTSGLDGTLILSLELFSKSKIHFINIRTAVYRSLETSVSHSFDLKKRYNYLYSVYKTQVYFYKRYSFLVEQSDFDYIENKWIKNNKLLIKVYGDKEEKSKVFSRYPLLKYIPNTIITTYLSYSNLIYQTLRHLKFAIKK